MLFVVLLLSITKPKVIDQSYIQNSPIIAICFLFPVTVDSRFRILSNIINENEIYQTNFDVYELNVKIY